MSKSVYSLVLSDDVVAQIDRAAYALGTSRSNLINQVLAEYVSLITPEKRRKDIFDSLVSVLGGFCAVEVGIGQAGRTAYSASAVRCASSITPPSSTRWSCRCTAKANWAS